MISKSTINAIMYIYVRDMLLNYMAKTAYKTAALLKYFKLNINVCNTMVY